jgi:type IV pilus assembly protein PilB
MVMRKTPQDLERARQQKIASLRHHEEEERARERAATLRLPYRDLQSTPIDGSALTLRPLEEQKAAKAAIIHHDDRRLSVAAEDPTSEAFLSFAATLREEGFTVLPIVVSASSLAYAWSRYERFEYLQTRITGEVAINQETFDRFQEEIYDVRDLIDRLAHMTTHDIAMLVELLLAGAIRLEASDIHVEPEASEAKIRFRLDGVLHDLIAIPKNVYRLLLERIKLLAGLKLNVTHRGQDGRFSIRVNGEEVEIRASTLPGGAQGGEFIVLRLLNPKNLLSIADLGLRDDLLAIIEEELKRPNGMILTTGPTGSGKTTMLYAFLRHVLTPEVKAITIEDPIEYHLEGLEQTQVDPEAGYTFASGLRSIVRQDPDIILVGEIRDAETADIATNAALTGHLVFSTLHTNDAAGAIPRLIEFGVNPAVLGPAINVIMAQRLVRRVCESCSTKVSPDPTLQRQLKEILANLPPHILARYDLDHPVIRRAHGCLKCHRTGYRGRIGIFELFRVDEDFERFALKRPSIVEVRTYAIEKGMVTLQQDALLRVLEGITTIEEVIRVTGPLSLPHDAVVPLEPEDTSATFSH